MVLIIKVGGSLLSPSIDNLFDWEYANQVSQFIKQLLAEGHSVVLSVGGGKLTRVYDSKAKSLGASDLELHRIGIAATNLHAEIMHALLGNVALPEVLRYGAYDQMLAGERPQLEVGQVLIAAAGRPGHSNDWNALKLAQAYGADKVFILKNVDGVYTTDPKLDPQAKLIPGLSWDNYLSTIGNPQAHQPGVSYPVDPGAASEARNAGMEFIILGRDLGNLRSAISSQEFKGTRITDRIT